MQPKTQYFTLYRGDTHLFKVSLTAENKPLDLSLSKFVMDIRATDGSIIQPTISIDGSDVWLLFPASLTADITWSRAEYDLRAVTGNVVKTYLRGVVTVSPSISRVELGVEDGVIHEEAVSIDVSGQAIIVQPTTGAAVDSKVIADLTVKITRLEAAVKDAEESEEIAALSERLNVAQRAIEQAGSLEGRLLALEESKEELSNHARELASQRANLESVLTRLTEKDQTVAALSEQLQALRTEVSKAEESEEIEALHKEIVAVTADLEAAKTAAAGAAASAEVSALRAKIAELEAVAEKQSKQATEIAELRSLLGMKKCEKIHLTQEMWADGGYTWTKVTFANTYKDPRVTLSLEHNNLVVLFLNHAICAKDGKGVSIRTNYDKPKIDVSYSVYLYVEEWNG